MFRRIIEILSNPLLYYVDKSGNSVFRNFCLVKETGNLYKTSIPKANAGKALEYRFQLDKYLKRVYILTPVVLYFIFIHLKFSLIGLLFFEFLWVLIITGARLYISSLYSDYLVSHFGKYEAAEFNPPVPKEKIREYVGLYKSKAVAIVVLIVLLFIPSFIMQGILKFDLSPKHNKFKQAVGVANTYFALYPKTESVYDKRAYAKFMSKDYEGALNDYKTVLDMSGKKFGKRDFVRFANLLYLQKKMSTPQEAVDVFNEYVTKKKMSTLEASQMLWVESIFKIENNIPEGIPQKYDELLTSVDSKDVNNKFYISCDKAYMYYLLEQYGAALNAYNMLISYAQGNQEMFVKELKSLYAERGWTKKRMGDDYGANADFISAGIPYNNLKEYEPSYSKQEFVVEKSLF